MNPVNERFYAVDRFEGPSAVLLDDAGRAITVPAARFPPKLKEGDVLRVPEKDGTLDWGRAVIDKRETERRRSDAKHKLDELKERDPGGDVTL